ncbi:MAG: hypothetical protein COB02_10385 [Candidatus Cloacimonadota bacterium]|nr:MAG: hypothetical protein COB02_10385 [Candidatus Cloacimonadota bacterium]
MKSFVIRAEQKNEWEGRSSITPTHAKNLKKDFGIDVHFESSTKRCFKDSEYIEAGATLVDDIEDHEIVVGVKEIPVEKFSEKSKTYFFFSHTIKGQKENMPMLEKVIASKSTMIDYEKITDDEHLRLVAFGYHAGVVGCVDSLWILGQKLKSQGISNKLEDFKQALGYENIETCRAHLREIGWEIAKSGFSDNKQPVVIGLLGEGKVSNGMKYILECLPIRTYTPLEFLANDEQLDDHEIHLVIFGPRHMVKKKGGGPYIREEYFQNPELYESNFEKYYDKFNLILNAIFWTPQNPIFISQDMFKEAFKNNKYPLVMGDVTCDINGSMECTTKPSDPGNPCYTYHPITKETPDGWNADGVTVLAVDNLPCEFSFDASKDFGDAMYPFWESIANSDYSKPLEECGFAKEIQKATIIYNGKLTKNYEYLQEFLENK